MPTLMPNYRWGDSQMLPHWTGKVILKKKKKNLETGFKSNFEYFQIFDFFFYFYVLQNVLSKVNVEEAKEIILYLSQGTVEVL